MSNSLFTKFNQIKEKYLKRREEFKDYCDSIISWSGKKIKLRGLSALASADEAIRAVEVFGSQVQDSVIKPHYKALKRAYRQLNEMTKPWWRQWIEAVVVALGLALILRNFIFGLYHVPTGSAEPNILVGDRIWGNKMAYYMSDVKRGELVIFDNPLHNFSAKGTFDYYWQRYVGFPIPALGLSAGADNWVKRVIGVPGDIVEGRVEDGKTVVYLNGKALEEKYVNPYPLIFMTKDRGFVDLGSLARIPVLSFFHKHQQRVFYTYDPSVPFSEQPFYAMDDNQIIRDSLTGLPYLRQPRSPSVEGEHVVDVFGPYRIPEGKYWVMGDSRKNSIDSRWWLFLDEELIHGRASFIIYSIDSEEPFWVFELIKHPIDFFKRYVRWNRFFTWLKTHPIE